MARIRSIHPKLFTDEAYMSLGHAAARFLFGLWTEADDHGVFEWKPITLKARILPAHNEDVNAILSELADNKVVDSYEVDGKRYGMIRNFCKFQKPKKPTYSYPLPDECRNYIGLTKESSPPVPHQEPTSGGNASLREEGGDNKEEIKGGGSKGPLSADAEQIGLAIQLWNETADKINLAKVQTVTKTRKSALLARLRSCGGIEGWKTALGKIEKIPWFYDGTARNGWTADFDFLVQERSFTKLMEGSYNGKFGGNAQKLTDLERTILAAC